MLSDTSDFRITGTHIWYYYICKREVWLISRQIEADPENELLELGRLNDQSTYQQEKKYLHFEGGVVDIFSEKNGKMVIAEVKKSSQFLESARMQLRYYLLKLKQIGILAEGELRIPKEKINQKVLLRDEDEMILEQVCVEIEQLVSLEVPPAPTQCHYCHKCAYQEFCWS